MLLTFRFAEARSRNVYRAAPSSSSFSSSSSELLLPLPLPDPSSSSSSSSSSSPSARAAAGTWRLLRRRLDDLSSVGGGGRLAGKLDDRKGRIVFQKSEKWATKVDPSS
jgi:hypothetical protein